MLTGNTCIRWGSSGEAVSTNSSECFRRIAATTATPFSGDLPVNGLLLGPHWPTVDGMFGGLLAFYRPPPTVYDSRLAAAYGGCGCLGVHTYAYYLKNRNRCVGR